MYLLIEHNGSKDHHDIASYIEDVISEDHELVVDHAIYEDVRLSLYNDILEKIISIDRKPTFNEIKLLCALMIN
jgi:hypothetical protein|tara:strand:- start:622 stop:843 length:222 start_codon:yes stop_codon:yes gene_type:complete